MIRFDKKIVNQTFFYETLKEEKISGNKNTERCEEEFKASWGVDEDYKKL